MGDWAQGEAGLKVIQSVGNGFLFISIPGQILFDIFVSYNSPRIYPMWIMQEHFS